LAPGLNAQDSESKTVADGRNQQDLAAQHQLLRARTKTTFRHVVFLSPLHESELGQSVWMAPILLQQIHVGADPTVRFPRFGAIKPSGNVGRSRIDRSQLTVYTTARRIRISGRLYRQDTYAWFYPSKDPDNSTVYRGFHQTLGRSGFPAVREVISSDSPQRIFFVSKSLEQAALTQFGAPLVGRKFSVESMLSEQPDALVARVLADGAQPMGPFVYLDSQLMIPNLKCRCEPSQVGEFTENQHYRLVPLDAFERLHSDHNLSPRIPVPANAAQLEGVLRMPRSW
jgi:hypothetical protein